MAKPYQKFLEDELILRDHLAIDRTILANERTFLAYIRTALAIIIAGGTLLKFFSETLYHVLGIIVLAMGFVTLLVGLWRYKTIRDAIKFDKGKSTIT